MKLSELTKNGPGDEATWGKPSGHPNDPRTDEPSEELSFDDHVTFSWVMYAPDGKEKPIDMTVSVEASRDYKEGGDLTDWSIESFTPSEVRVDGKTMKYTEFVKTASKTDNDALLDPKKFKADWISEIEDAMKKQK